MANVKRKNKSEISKLKIFAYFIGTVSIICIMFTGKNIMTRNDALKKAASILGINPNWINRVIQSESRWNPKAKNPYASARGLIQIVDATAKGIGFKDSLDAVTRNPDEISQLFNIAVPYWQLYAPFANDAEFYLANFLPAWRKKPLITVLPANIQKVNPGLITLGDYVKKVQNTITIPVI